MFSSDDLSELVAVDARPAVSLYLPTHVAGREIRQDPIRLKNLIASTAKQIRKNYPKAVAEALPAARLARRPLRRDRDQAGRSAAYSSRSKAA